jgi:hypothetical protein
MATLDCTASEKFVVLVDEKFASGTPVSECMSTLEHFCDEADTFFGAVEKFSDFTLRAVPELIFVPVSTLPKRLEDLEKYSFESNVRVFGLDGNSRKRRSHNVAHSLDQLEAMIGAPKSGTRLAA